MALPKGLLIRSNGYYFQARIPKKYHSHYPSLTIYDKLPTDNRKDAERMVYDRWHQLHQEFLLIDSTGSTFNVLSDEDISRLTHAFIYETLADDDNRRAEGQLDDSYVVGLEVANSLFKEGYAEGLPNNVAYIVDYELRRQGLNVPRNTESHKKLTLAFLKAGITSFKKIEQRNSGEAVETPPAPLKVKLEVTSTNSLDSLEDLRDYWLTQPTKASGGKKSKQLSLSQYYHQQV